MSNVTDKSPYAQEGDTKMYKSACRMCHGGLLMESPILGSKNNKQKEEKEEAK